MRSILFAAVTVLSVTYAPDARASEPEAPASSPAPPASSPAPSNTESAGQPVVVDVSVPSIIDEAAIRAAVARELEQPVVAPGSSASSASPHLAITLRTDGMLEVSFRDEAGRTIARTVAAPRDAIATIQLIAMLSGNLARNQSGALEAELAVHPEPASTPSTPSAAQQAPVVIVMQAPPTAPTASTRDAGAAAQNAIDDPFHRGHFAFHVGGFGGASIGTRYPLYGASLGLTVRARHLAFELAGGYGGLPWMQLALGSLVMMGRVEFGRFEFAAGGGAAMAYANGWMVGATALARLTCAIVGPLDAYAQVEGSYLLSTAIEEQRGAVILANVGLQVRVGR